MRNILANRNEVHYNEPLVVIGVPVCIGYDTVEKEKVVMKILNDDKKALG